MLRDSRCCHHRRRRRVCAPTSNTSSHDMYDKINSRVSFYFPYEYGAQRSAALRAAGAPLLKFSFIVRPRREKHKKGVNMVIQFPLFMSFNPHCQTEFQYIENGPLFTPC